MRIFIFLLLLPVFCFSQPGLQLRHINIVNVTNGKIVPNQVVSIQGNKIVSIQNDTGKPVTAKNEIDCNNKYLVPGLWDMHYHSEYPGQSQEGIFPLMLANGVTGIRNMWGTSDDLLVRDSVRRGLLTAPRMVVGSPLIDGAHSVFTDAVNTDDPKRIPFIIDSLHALGYDFMKSYEFITKDVFHAISNYCRSKNIPFAGHTPVVVSVEDASNSGIRSIEHLTGIIKAFSTVEDSVSKVVAAEALHMKSFGDFANTFFDNESYKIPFNEKKAEHVVAVLKKNNTAMVPTLSIYRGYLFDVDSLQRMQELKYVPKAFRESWFNMKKGGLVDTNYLSRQLKNLGFLYSHGITILAGTDAPNPYVVYGFSLHDELEWYVKAGMSPLAALQSSTINPARFLHMDKELGTVEKNKIADLLILNANPLNNIRNTRAIEAVIVNGRLLSRNDLDFMLDKVRTRYE